MPFYYFPVFIQFGPVSSISSVGTWFMHVINGFAETDLTDITGQVTPIGAGLHRLRRRIR